MAGSPLTVLRESVTLKVLLAETSASLHVDLASTVLELKERILQDATLGPNARGRRMRLIHAGRMLRDGDSLVASGVKSDACIHVAVSDVKPSPALVTRPPGGGSPRRATADSHVVTIDNSDQAPSSTSDSSDEATEPPAPLAGLNRLQAIGMDPESVATLRSHFWQQIIALESEVARLPNEEPSDHLLRVEGVWMERQTADSEFGINIAPLIRQHQASVAAAAAAAATSAAATAAATTASAQPSTAGAAAGSGAGMGVGMGTEGGWLRMGTAANSSGEAHGAVGGGGGGATAPNDTSFLQRMRALDVDSEGTFSDFLWGMLMGFFLGMLMLLWVAQESVSSKQKMGVFMGIFCNMALTLMRNSSMMTGEPAA